MDSVLVTLEIKSIGVETDLSCPANKPVRFLREEILNVLREQYGSKMNPVQSISIEFNGRELTGDQTLASVGAWDGSYIFAYER